MRKLKKHFIGNNVPTQEQYKALVTVLKIKLREHNINLLQHSNPVVYNIYFREAGEIKQELLINGKPTYGFR